MENDELIQKLETLKSEAAIITEKVSRTDETLVEIKEVTNEYVPLAMMTTRIFFTMQSLGTISYLYQYSLQQFTDLVHEVLNAPGDVSAIPKTDPQRRLQAITRQLFVRTNNMIGHGLREEHKLLFTLRLAQIRLGEDRACEPLFEAFLSTTAMLEPERVSTGLLGGRLTRSQLAQLEDLGNGPHLNGLIDSMESNEARWLQVLDHEQPASILPEPWMAGEDSSVVNEAARLLKKLLVIRILRPDRTCALAESLAVKVLGGEVSEHPSVDLAEFISDRFRASNPLLMVSAPGYDASYKVDILAK